MAKSDWVASGIVCQQLGISQKHLWRLRDENLLRKNYHWKNIARPQAARPTYRWHLKRCEKALEIEPEVRGFAVVEPKETEPILEAIDRVERGELDPIDGSRG